MNEIIFSKLSQQIEYYFSDKNLKNDAFIRNQLLDNGYFPIIDLIQFPKINVFFPFSFIRIFLMM